ncbi:Sec-independent protein translocase protein TatB [Microbulbifer magnicolonia]|uniref:Sec-independent protein translocase protein TatB n=1 Tax=Microbulbifer magnicolonia TaxID=3109744 RepID=UPI002B404D11|nr:Sec-independent protein translocase protein TatB [Microbulbifer sp. GG15]
MFDIGFFELLLIGVVALLVVGPERLPDAVRTTSRWWSSIKRTLHNAREELEREVGADEIRRELHNERIMRELEESRREMEQAFSEVETEARAPEEKAAPPAEQPFDPSHPTADADDYLPEQDEDAEELQDPEYPEHWHDYGDPELNPDHPDHAVKKEASPQEKDKQP